MLRELQRYLGSTEDAFFAFISASKVENVESMPSPLHGQKGRGGISLARAKKTILVKTILNKSNTKNFSFHFGLVCFSLREAFLRLFPKVCQRSWTKAFFIGDHNTLLNCLKILWDCVERMWKWNRPKGHGFAHYDKIAFLLDYDQSSLSNVTEYEVSTSH